ncbi:MAG: hypothetical protein AB7H93_04755 [Vicinamibacterales bacterium]
MARRSRVALAAWSLGMAVALTAPLSGQGRGLGQSQPGERGRKARAEQAAPVPGARHGRDAIEALQGDLGPRVRDRGIDVEAAAAVLASDDALWVDDEGQLMFVDVMEHEAGPGGGEPETEPPAPTGPPPTPLFLQANGLPIHHSRPGAPWTLYIDVDGEFVRNTFWPTSMNNKITGALTIDTDPTTFTAEEQAVVSRIWGRVAEDWLPFDMDVTTERPAEIGGRVLWAIVGDRPTDLGLPNGVGGISLFTLQYVPFGFRTPTFTFWGVWGATNHDDIADTISQECGHMFGLLHDGVRSPLGFDIEYYGGHGSGATSWGPIMGDPQARNVSQWSRGEYPGAINPSYAGVAGTGLQDDLAIIAGKLGYRADDHADTIGGAQPLTPPTSGAIAVHGDVDVFALPIANDVRIEITPFRAGEQTDGGNLDVAAEILNAQGVVVASVDDLEQTAATLAADLPLTQHYLRVRASANPVNYTTYASLGHYTVTGTFVRTVAMTGFQEPLTTAVLNAGRMVPVKFTLTQPVAEARVLLLPSALSPVADALAETSCKAQAGGRQHCNLKLPRTIDSGATYWIVAQFEDLDGHWVTAGVASGAAAANPMPVVVQ